MIPELKKENEYHKGMAEIQLLDKQVASSQSRLSVLFPYLSLSLSLPALARQIEQEGSHDQT
jgi:hypothetical protein